MGLAAALDIGRAPPKPPVAPPIIVGRPALENCEVVLGGSWAMEPFDCSRSRPGDVLPESWPELLVPFSPVHCVRQGLV